MARIRTFIAIDLAAGVKDRLTALQETLARNAGGVKWVPIANLHLTILFLGEVEHLEVMQVCRLVQSRARKYKAFTLAVEGLGAFPNARRPKILWAGITQGTEELRAVHTDLEEGLLELGSYRREDRQYTPHLTLGRLTPDERAESWAAVLAERADWHGGTTPVDELLVMSSILRRDGPEYSIMGRAPLGQK